MRSIPLLLLLPLLPSFSRGIRSFPRRTQPWIAPGTWWRDTADFDKESKTVIPTSPAPPLKCLLLSGKHLRNQKLYSIRPSLKYHRVKKLPSLLLEKQKPCFPRSFPKRIINIPGWLLWTLDHAKHL